MGGGIYSRPWYQEGLGTNAIQLVPNCIQMTLQKLPVPLGAPPCPPCPAPTPSLSHCSTPRLWARSLAPSSHLTLLGRRAQQRGKRRGHASPQGKEDPAKGLGAVGAPCARRSEGWRWEIPFASVPSSPSHPAFFIIPLQRPPSPSQKCPPD